MFSHSRTEEKKLSELFLGTFPEKENSNKCETNYQEQKKTWFIQWKTKIYNLNCKYIHNLIMHVFTAASKLVVDLPVHKATVIPMHV